MPLKAGNMQYNKLYKLLFDAVQKGTVEAAQKAASNIFESAVSVTDTAFRVLSADTDPGSTNDMLEKYGNHIYVSEKLLNLFREHNLISNLTAKPHKTIVVDWGYFSKHPHITTGIFWQNQIIGTIVVLVKSASFSDKENEALQACANALALIMHTSESGKHKLSVDKDNFISKLFHRVATQNDLKRAMNENYFSKDERYVVHATEYNLNQTLQEKISKNSHLLLYSDKKYHIYLQMQKMLN